MVERQAAISTKLDDLMAFVPRRKQP